MPNPNVSVPITDKFMGAFDDHAKGFVNGSHTSPFTAVTAATTLTPEQNNVDVTTVSASYAVTLPSAAACMGRGLYTIRRSAAGAGGFTANVTSPDGDLVQQATAVVTRNLLLAGDIWVGFSDGLRWHELRAIVNDTIA